MGLAAFELGFIVVNTEEKCLFLYGNTYLIYIATIGSERIDRYAGFILILILIENYYII